MEFCFQWYLLHLSQFWAGQVFYRVCQKMWRWVNFCQALCPFCVCVSNSSKMDTDSSYFWPHPPTGTFFWCQMKGMAKIRLFDQFCSQDYIYSLCSCINYLSFFVCLSFFLKDLMSRFKFENPFVIVLTKLKQMKTGLNIIEVKTS